MFKYNQKIRCYRQLLSSLTNIMQLIFCIKTVNKNKYPLMLELFDTKIYYTSIVFVNMNICLCKYYDCIKVCGAQTECPRFETSNGHEIF